MGRQRRFEEALKRDRFAPTAREVESPEVEGELSAKLRLPQQTAGRRPSVSVRMGASSVWSVDETPGDQ